MLSSIEEQWTNEPLGGFQVYKDEGWLSWRDFLGYGEGQLPVGDFLPFEEAREVARPANVLPGAGKPHSSQSSEQLMVTHNAASPQHPTEHSPRGCVSQWREWRERPWNVPSAPNLTYANQWVSWDDWFGL